MAKSKRKPTHEELQRDEIADSLHDIVETIHRLKYVILAAILIIIAVAVAWRYVDVRRGERLIALNQAVTETIQDFHQLESLTEPEERQEAAASLVETLEEVIQTHGTSQPLGRFALYLKGMTHYSVDEFGPARSAFNQYLAEARNDEESARGEIALAYAYENEGFFPADPESQRSLLDLAQNHYLRASGIARQPHPYLHYYAVLGQARVHEAIGENQEALDLYRQILEERPPRELEPIEDIEAPDRQQRALIRMLARMMREAEEPLSLTATAQLRLERLEARMGIAPDEGPVTTVIAP